MDAGLEVKDRFRGRGIQTAPWRKVNYGSGIGGLWDARVMTDKRGR